MMTATRNRNLRQGLLLSAITTAIVAVAAPSVQAQEAIGVPFIGSNHLSFSVTELSRDGIGKDRVSVFGGVYGHQYGARSALQTSFILRAGARPLDGVENGVLDAGLTLAVQRAVPALGALRMAGAVGAGAVAWGRGNPETGEPDTGKLVLTVPVSAGMSYDLQIGGATIAPFARVTGAYSTMREYEDNERVLTDDGWRISHSAGLAVRFQETVLSISGIHRERGLPNTNRVLFSAGLSW